MPQWLLGRIQGGGSRGPRTPLVPREGVLDPSSKMKKTAFFICFIYYPAIMPQNSSQGTKSQNFRGGGGGLQCPPNPQLHMESFIQVLIHLWHVEILIVCVLDKITVLFSIYIYLQKYILKILIDLQIDLGEKQKHIYLLCELHTITSRKYEGMFLLEKKWKNSIKMFYLLSCYNASEQLSGHQISTFSGGGGGGRCNKL